MAVPKAPVLGGKTARPGNLSYTYFVNLLGAAEDGHRVVYAESVFDEKGADGILAQLSVISLVRGQDYGFLGSTQQISHFFISSSDTCLSIHHKDNYVSFFDG